MGKFWPIYYLLSTILIISTKISNEKVSVGNLFFRKSAGLQNFTDDSGLQKWMDSHVLDSGLQQRDKFLAELENS